jgi:hypothetical protein
MLPLNLTFYGVFDCFVKIGLQRCGDLYSQFGEELGKVLESNKSSRVPNRADHGRIGGWRIFRIDFELKVAPVWVISWVGEKRRIFSPFSDTFCSCF